jgi:hypothetical protein
VGGADALAESVIRPTPTRVSSGILSDSEIQKRAQKGESRRFPEFGQESSKLMSIIGHMSDVSLISPSPSTLRSTGAFCFDDCRKTVKMLNHERERPLK